MGVIGSKETLFVEVPRAVAFKETTSSRMLSTKVGRGHTKHDAYCANNFRFFEADDSQSTYSSAGLREIRGGGACMIQLVLLSFVAPDSFESAQYYFPTFPSFFRRLGS